MNAALPRLLLRGAALAVAVGFGVTGCTSTDAMNDASSAGGEAAQQQQAHRGAPAQDATGGVLPAGEVLDRDVIQRADLTVRTSDLGRALVRARAVVRDAGGFVADENTETDGRGKPRRSTLSLRVPADTFAGVLDDLGELGRVRAQHISTEDVSTQVVDVDARVASAERTLRRIRELLQEADDFSDVLSLEAELARREADLASLKAQQAYLEDQTSLSTVTLTLLPRPTGPADEGEPDGFVAGLATGWGALSTVVAAILTGLGVLTPLLVLLVPLGLATWWGVRRLVRRQPASSPPVDA